MSAYIHSQYLLQRITSDFFQNAKQEQPLSWKAIPSQNMGLDEDEVHGLSEEDDQEEHLAKSDYYDNDIVSYCHPDNVVSLSHEFDLCNDQAYTVMLCPYKINYEGRYPFVQYYLVPGDNDAWTFPQFPFRCASNIVHDDEERSAKHLYFENECMKSLLNFAEPSDTYGDDEDDDHDQIFETVYKGYMLSDSTIYVVLDMERFEIRDKQTHVFATVDEIVNLHACKTKPIASNVCTLFYGEKGLLHLYSEQQQPIPSPIIGYKCLENGEGTYENKEETSDGTMSLLDERVSHPLIENSFLFSRNLLVQGETFQRYAMFIEGGDSPLTPLERGEPSLEEGGESPLEKGSMGEESESPLEEGGKGGESPLNEESTLEEGGKGGTSPLPLYFQQNIGDQAHAFWSLPSASYFVEL